MKEVVLFTSGVGFFEHYGTVQGNATTELSFKSAQINDILKSLLLEDRDGGKVSVVTYASQEPLERTLRSFEVDLSNNPPLAQILNQLRGSSVTASVAGGAPITGHVLGVEQKQKSAGENKVIEVWVLNLLLNSGSIRPVELDTISEIRLDDPKLQQELVKALAAVAASRDQDKKPVTLRFNGEGERRVRIGYVVEMPPRLEGQAIGSSSHRTLKARFRSGREEASDSALRQTPPPKPMAASCWAGPSSKTRPTMTGRTSSFRW